MICGNKQRIHLRLLKHCECSDSDEVAKSMGAKVEFALAGLGCSICLAKIPKQGSVVASARGQRLVQLLL